MKGAVIVISIFCFVLAVSCDDSEYEAKKEKIHKYLKCVACAPPDSEIRAEHKTCAALKPPRIVSVLKTCCSEIMPDVTDEETAWNKICEDVEVIDKIHGCLRSKVPKSEITDEEKAQFSKYKECATKLNEEKCH